MNLPQTFENLIEEAHTLNLYEKLIAQLNKDLTYANVDLYFNTSVLPSSLRLMLQEVVYKLINEKFMDYLNLLYIVDVSEEKVRSLDGMDTYKLSADITFLILQRVWQKVWFKNKYA
ncbi:hypothetical protein J4050_01915 [Winogradskyella sp. DF17]|jgi:hypothetical protein|uniref:Uncharacterized protein n=1 Tax=Winogradskyella pelagia TaxID=2819984 RepID=A0ABS3SYB4_9FLAO|nr:hypothetical protein [Winogradskyella sp. DF17]MBO3115483.1 hypothetical protein [Winogradskyella sp. DF17]